MTKVLGRKDAEFHPSEAKAALMKEITKLEEAGVWDKVPEEKHDVVRSHPDASFSRIFSILGLKRSETPTPIQKARVVLMGNNMKDQEGEQVYFADTSSAPTCMSCVSC